MISAHRGGMVYAGYPENCLETFDYVLSQVPAIIECDIQMTKDSVLILMHDESIDRTTNGSGKVKNMHWEELSVLQLKDQEGKLTDYRIPQLGETLDWAKGKTILQLDIKLGVPFKKVLGAVESRRMANEIIIIVYDVKDAQRVYELNSDVKLSVSMRNLDEAYRMINSGVPTFNMIAFTGTRESPKALYDFIHQNGILCILGTLGNLDRSVEARGDKKYLDYIQQGIDVLATNRPIEAAQAVLSADRLEQYLLNR